MKERRGRSESGRTTGGGGRRENTHFFQPATHENLELETLGATKRLSVSWFKQPAGRENPLNCPHGRKNQVSQNGNRVGGRQEEVREEKRPSVFQ